MLQREQPLERVFLLVEVTYGVTEERNDRNMPVLVTIPGRKPFAVYDECRFDRVTLDAK